MSKPEIVSCVVPHGWPAEGRVMHMTPDAREDVSDPNVWKMWCKRWGHAKGNITVGDVVRWVVEGRRVRGGKYKRDAVLG